MRWNGSAYIWERINTPHIHWGRRHRKKVHTYNFIHCRVQNLTLYTTAASEFWNIVDNGEMEKFFKLSKFFFTNYVFNKFIKSTLNFTDVTHFSQDFFEIDNDINHLYQITTDPFHHTTNLRTFWQKKEVKMCLTESIIIKQN